MRRKIIERRRYRTPSHPRSAADSVLVLLECGHWKGYKGSKEPQGGWVFCKECGLVDARRRWDESP